MFHFALSFYGNGLFNQSIIGQPHQKTNSLYIKMIRFDQIYLNLP